MNGTSGGGSTGDVASDVAEVGAELAGSEQAHASSSVSSASHHGPADEKREQPPMMTPDLKVALESLVDKIKRNGKVDSAHTPVSRSPTQNPSEDLCASFQVLPAPNQCVASHGMSVTSSPQPGECASGAVKTLCGRPPPGNNQHESASRMMRAQLLQPSPGVSRDGSAISDRRSAEQTKACGHASKLSFEMLSWPDTFGMSSAKHMCRSAQYLPGTLGMSSAERMHRSAEHLPGILGKTTAHSLSPQRQFSTHNSVSPPFSSSCTSLNACQGSNHCVPWQQAPRPPSSCPLARMIEKSKGRADFTIDSFLIAYVT
mmetsp:Transcript_67959/g.121008  ORF Transcript_67959/g.121008 Transcript_67959/m.121008 type:complete len:316 (-) Transcript_67959:132-1079(-)